MYSILYVEYDNSLSLTKNCKRLGLAYGLKGSVRRIYALINRNGHSVQDVRYMSVLQPENGHELRFRVFFDYEVVEVYNRFILHGSKN